MTHNWKSELLEFNQGFEKQSLYMHIFSEAGLPNSLAFINHSQACRKSNAVCH
jgi:hypothetical protein